MSTNNMIIILNKSDVEKKVCDLDAFHRHQFQMLCEKTYDAKFFQYLEKHSISELRKANGLGIDRFLAITGEIR